MIGRRLYAATVSSERTPDHKVVAKLPRGAQQAYMPGMVEVADHVDVDAGRLGHVSAGAGMVTRSGYESRRRQAAQLAPASLYQRPDLPRSPRASWSCCPYPLPGLVSTLGRITLFDRATDYPCAVTSSDDDGVEEGIQWCLRHLGPDDTLTVWTKLKSNLRNNRRLSELARRSNVDHMTGHGGAYLSGRGPVLMAWAHLDDIGELVRFGAEDITGLCVISWNVERLRPWVVAQRPEILGDASDWEDLEESAEIDQVVVEALESLTLTVNHNNTIAAGFEKDQVVEMLLLLRKHRYPIRLRDGMDQSVERRAAGA
jgi:hypothetical protein